VYKISKTGEVIAQSAFPKADSNYALHFGFPKKNGNLLFMGILADTVNSYLARYTYLCELTPDLEMVWETIDAIPSPPVDTTRHYPRNFLITPEEEIIIQGTVDTVRYGYNDLLYLTKYDMQGNRLQFHLYPSWKDHGLASELLFNSDSTGFYLIGALSLNSISKDWIEFDLELNLLSSGTLTDENSLLWSPISVVRLDNGNIVIANQLAEFDNWYSYGVEMRLYNTEFELLKTSIYYTEKTVYTPLKRGIGHVNDSCIWVAAFENNPTGILGKEDIIFLVYDSELNLLGEKIHQGDRRYWILDLLPCSDSGCLIAGIVAEYEGADWADNYLLKVQLHDVVTSTIEHFNPDQR
ncbi:MAG: hypothetical protein K8F24_12155, partial [Bacteroidales bacterium]|nr:hypothetical protein [Bacteroidales bacterium]